MLKERKSIPCWAIYSDGTWVYVAEVNLHRWRFFGKDWIVDGDVVLDVPKTGTILKFVVLHEGNYIHVPIMHLNFK